MQQEIPLTQKIYDLYKDIYQVIEKMPKKDKYSIGLKIDKGTLDLLELIITAGSIKGSDEKINMLTISSSKLDLLKLLVRLAYDIKAIDKKKYLSLEEGFQEIGRMLGGWLKFVKQ